MFTGSVTSVSATKIFGRCDGDEQLLAYAMRMDADVQVAMVLPLPVVVGAGDDAVRFIDLSGFPQLFTKLGALFVGDLSAEAPAGWGVPQARSPLVVHEVGSFVASYVPSVAAFDRLDERFRLSAEVWASLPQFADFGFGVFQLAPGNKDVHPMALAFPSRDPARVHFPCVHVHDGVVHTKADFDHDLYVQPAGGREPQGALAWEASAWPPTSETVASSQALLTESTVYRTQLSGLLPNRDVSVG